MSVQNETFSSLGDHLGNFLHTNAVTIVNLPIGAAYTDLYNDHNDTASLKCTKKTCGSWKIIKSWKNNTKPTSTHILPKLEVIKLLNAVFSVDSSQKTSQAI